MSEEERVPGTNSEELRRTLPDLVTGANEAASRRDAPVEVDARIPLLRWIRGGSRYELLTDQPRTPEYEVHAVVDEDETRELTAEEVDEALGNTQRRIDKYDLMHEEGGDRGPLYGPINFIRKAWRRGKEYLSKD